MSYHDPQASVYLAKLIGLYMLIIGVWWVINRSAVPKMIEEMYKNEMLLAVMGVLALTTGLAIIIGHNVWEKSPVVLITLVGWLSFLKGLSRLFFRPKSPRQLAMQFTEGPGFAAMLIIIFGFGAVLTYYGFSNYLIY